MKYMGSKNRIAKYILPIILKDRKPNQWYVEPFAGGMNMIDKVDGNRIANDNNKYLIAMWESLINGNEFPTHISKQEYSVIRNEYNNDTSLYSDDYVGWVGYMASANGRFFEGGYSGKSNTKIGTVRDYISESIRNVQKQIPYMKGVNFKCTDYTELEIPENSIIYCDIPYKGTKQYSTSKGFDHDKFWRWCTSKSEDGHTVYVSEYEAPKEAKLLWQKELKSSLRANSEINGNKTSIEKLFLISP